MSSDLEWLLVAYARAGQALHGCSSEQERLDLGVQLAVELIPGCTHAAVVQRRRRTLAIGATSDEVAWSAEAFALTRHTGPTQQALRRSTMVFSADLTSETRWEIWTRYARVDLGVAAVVSRPLLAGNRAFGALTLYLDRAPLHDGVLLAASEALATHLGLALDYGSTIEHQVLAIDRRTVIGQAQGILMARSGLTPDTSFSYLQRLSQHSNRKLHTIAAAVVRRGGPIPDLLVAQAADESVSSGGVAPADGSGSSADSVAVANPVKD